MASSEKLSGLRNYRRDAGRGVSRSSHGWPEAECADTYGHTDGYVSFELSSIDFEEPRLRSTMARDDGVIHTRSQGHMLSERLS